MNKLQEVLEAMEETFSSNEFCDLARELGFSEVKIAHGHVGKFLHDNCEQNGSRRSWKKIDIKPKNLFSIESEIQKAIALLKENGYRVLKVRQEWEEL